MSRSQLPERTIGHPGVLLITVPRSPRLLKPRGIVAVHQWIGLDHRRAFGRQSPAGTGTAGLRQSALL
jgi:hypothetical protein